MIGGQIVLPVDGAALLPQPVFMNLPAAMPAAMPERLADVGGAAALPPPFAAFLAGALGGALAEAPARETPSGAGAADSDPREDPAVPEAALLVLPPMPAMLAQPGLGFAAAALPGSDGRALPNADPVGATPWPSLAPPAMPAEAGQPVLAPSGPSANALVTWSAGEAVPAPVGDTKGVDAALPVAVTGGALIGADVATAAEANSAPPQGPTEPRPVPPPPMAAIIPRQARLSDEDRADAPPVADTGAAALSDLLSATPPPTPAPFAARPPGAEAPRPDLPPLRADHVVPPPEPVLVVPSLALGDVGISVEGPLASLIVALMPAQPQPVIDEQAGRLAADLAAAGFGLARLEVATRDRGGRRQSHGSREADTVLPPLPELVARPAGRYA